MPDPLNAPRRPLADRLGTTLARALAALPERVQLALSGGAPVVRDGARLSPELQIILAVDAKRSVLLTSDPATLRKQQRSATSIAGGRPVEVGDVRELTVEGAEGRLRARHYVPSRSVGAPLLVFFHGGGFVFGDLDTHDASCRMLCRHGSMHVLAIDYRLAPEHPFPAAVEDARAALRWAFAHAAELGADPTRIAVGGDSAGANLAAATAQLAARDGGPAPTCQMLIYPAVDRTRPYASLELFAEGFLLTRGSIAWFHEQYVGSRAPLTDPRHAPLHAASFEGLAPALVVTAGFDPLRDEGEAYAAALVAAGVPTLMRRFEALTHGFFNMVGVSTDCRLAVVEIAGATRALLATSPPSTATTPTRAA
jgi:acetyl esterase